MSRVVVRSIAGSLLIILGGVLFATLPPLAFWFGLTVLEEVNSRIDYWVLALVAHFAACAVLFGLAPVGLDILLTVTGRCYELGFRLASHRILVSDVRPNDAIVLYLRSFRADEYSASVSRPRKWRALSGLAHNAWSTGRPEWLLAEEMYSIGPTVALGRPGERLPPVGVSRLYVEGQDWRSVVTRLIRQSILVVVVLDGGRSAGLHWELQYLRENLAPDRLVLVPSLSEANSTQASAFAAFNDLLQEVFRTRPIPTPADVVVFDRTWKSLAFSGADRESLDDAVLHACWGRVVAHCFGRAVRKSNSLPVHFRVYNWTTIGVMIILWGCFLAWMGSVLLNLFRWLLGS